EVASALNGSVGKIVRYSSTVGANLLYLAFPITNLEETAVLRTAVPIASIEESLQQIRGFLLRLALGTLVAASFFAFIFSRHVVRPLKEMTFFARRMARGQFDPP